MGDGTAGFHFAEFETAVRNKLPFVAVIGHDAQWNAEVQLQLKKYGEDRLIGCALDETRYDLVVQGLGGHGEYVTDPADLDAAIKRAVDSGMPACVNVRIEGLPAPSVSGQ
jgi:acetolactate synthase-1/2/3 large subunit